MQVSARNYSIFRFAFGVLMIQQILALLPFIHDLENSTIVLHYPNLFWIEAYSHLFIDAVALFAVLGALLLAIGIIPRIGAFLFCVCFGYLFLIDISFYNNHYYLWCLIAFLFIIVDDNRGISVIDLFKNKHTKSIDISLLFPFKLLLSIVYFYAAIAKINVDWLQGYPTKIWLEAHGVPNADFFGLGMAWFGLFFDLLIPLGLWLKPKKWYVVIPYFGFHIINMQAFNIGMFPPVMMVAWLLFIPQVPFLSVFKTSMKADYNTTQFYILTFFFIFQILFPLRLWASEGKPSWDRQGYYFAWRMMLDNYQLNYFQYKVVTHNPDNKYFVQFDKLVTYRQFQNTYNDPYSIWLIAQKLKSDAIKKYKTTEVSVYCKSIVQLNQHQQKSLTIDTVDIGNCQYLFYKKNKFITTF